MATPKKKTAPTKTAKAKPAAAKRSKPHADPATPTTKFSQIEAAVEVLRAAGEPMTCKQMVEAMAKKKLWTSPGGKTPEATLYASILRELATKGKDARFVRPRPAASLSRPDHQPHHSTRATPCGSLPFPEEVSHERLP